MQRRLAKDAENDEISAKDRAMCASAWQRLEAQRLDTAGVPRPGQYRPDLKPAKNQRSKLIGWTEPTVPATVIEALPKVDDDIAGQS